jgi:type VI secretion system secreted protein VgrG
LEKLPDTRVKLYDQQIRALNQITGEPIVGMPYKLTTASRETFYGFTDVEGKTIRVKSAEQEKVWVDWGKLPPTNLT